MDSANNSCNCPRLLQRAFRRPKLNGTCSDEYASYTTGQNVVSFCYYEPAQVKNRRLELGNNYTPPTYQIGIMENLRRMREVYPGFVMRLYTDVPLEGEYCSMVCSNPDLHWCDIRQTPLYGNLSSMFFMTWRFLPLGDPTVDIVLSRDLDSILTEREGAAVKDWLWKTNKSISLMRDHRDHNVPILGGTWGLSNRRLRSKFGAKELGQLQLALIEDSRLGSQKGWDQNVLVHVLLWKQAYREAMVAYDSYTCDYWRELSLVRPFPVQRRNAETDFVGNVELGTYKYNVPECPVSCRPSYGKNWYYC